MERTGPTLNRSNRSVLVMLRFSLVVTGCPSSLATYSAKDAILSLLPPIITNWAENGGERVGGREDGREGDKPNTMRAMPLRIVC